MLGCKTEARCWIISGEQNIRLPMVSLIRWENANQSKKIGNGLNKRIFLED